MKKIAKSIGCLLIMLLAITGCGQVGAEGKGKKGCYVEKKVEYASSEEIKRLNKTYDGKIAYYTYDKAAQIATIYSLNTNDNTWEKTSDIPWHPSEEHIVLESAIGTDSLFELTVTETSGGGTISEYYEDGTSKSIELKDEEGPHTFYSNEWYTLSKAENGDYLIQEGWGGALTSFDGETGELKNRFTDKCICFNVTGNQVVCTSYRPDNIYVFDVKSGEEIESVEYDIQSNINSVDVDEENIYLVNTNGVLVKSREGGEWKVIVEPDGKKLGAPPCLMINAYSIDGKSFLTFLDNGSSYYYYYDPEAIEVVNDEVTVFMPWNIDLVLKAISAYQMEHKDVKIKVEYYNNVENPLDVLNTELMAGKGPDLLIMDILPIYTYIEKGMLVDLSDIANECYKKEGCYKNVIDAFKEGKKVWAIPMRFKVPMVWGKEEIIDNAYSMETLAGYRDSHPDEVLIQKNMVELAYQLNEFCEPLITDGTKKYSREKAEKYINELKTIGVQEGEITEEVNQEIMDIEQCKYSELLDFTEGKSNIFFLSPRSILDIFYGDATLDARKEEKLGVRPLEIDGQVPFMPAGIMGINKNSKHQDIVKEIIRIALDEQVQQNANALGLPITEEYEKLQEESFKESEMDEMVDDKGRSVLVDTEVSRVLTTCHKAWKDASLCCTHGSRSLRETPKLITINEQI